MFDKIVVVKNTDANARRTSSHWNVTAQLEFRYMSKHIILWFS